MSEPPQSNPENPTRPSLPTSSSAFALPASAAASNSTTTAGNEDGYHMAFRFRRPSLLAPKASYLASSPLVATSTPIWRRRRSQIGIGDEADSDKEKMLTDSSPSSTSGNPTPPLTSQSEGSELELKQESTQAASSSTMTSRRPLQEECTDTQRKHPPRRFSHPIKPVRIMNLVAEARPEDSEVKSEAAFQRLLASCAELPTPARGTRAQDRGRYPEEAGQDDSQHEQTGSDDDGEDEIFESTLNNNDSITTTRSSTSNGDDFPVPESPSIPMEIDMPMGSPISSSSNHWRYTPPPTSGATRTNKRKLEDRYDPYPSASKRRAVSPSSLHRRDTHTSLISPIVTSSRGPCLSSRLPLTLPIAIPKSAPSSVASSPTISHAHPSSFNGRHLHSSAGLSSSPIQRSVAGLASPVLRPIQRRRLGSEEKEIDGAGEAVKGMSLEV